MCPNVANGPKIFSFSILLGMIILVDYDFCAEFCLGKSAGRQAITFVSTIPITDVTGVANASIYLLVNSSFLALVCHISSCFGAHQNLQRSVHAHCRCMLFHDLPVVPT